MKRRILLFPVFLIQVNCLQAQYTWSAVGAGNALSGAGQGEVHTLSVHNNKLYAGGTFDNAGGVSTSSNIAQWDGASWSGINLLGGSSGFVYSLGSYNNELYAGGNFYISDGIDPDPYSLANLARWDGTTWSGVGPKSTVFGQKGVNDVVTANPVVYNSTLYVGGSFTYAGNTNAKGITSWDGNTFGNIGAGIVYDSWALMVFNNELFTGGSMWLAGGMSVDYAARWNFAASAWSPAGSGMNGMVVCFAVYQGELFAGGEFTTAGGNTVNCIAKWNGSNWIPVGSSPGVTGGSPYSRIWGMAVWNNKLFVGGNFNMAGGRAANNIAYWDGTSWNAVDPIGVTAASGDMVECLTVYNNALYVGGQFPSAGGIANTMSIAKLSATATPVELISFTGASRENDVLLEWETSSETDCDFFCIEKSSNGNTYHEAGTLSASGTLRTGKKYSFADPDPFSGTAYYRLRIVEKNGEESFSPVIEVFRHPDGFLKLSGVFYDPASGNVKFNVNSPSDQLVSVRIIDVMGKMVSEKIFFIHSGNNPLVMDASTHSSGIYFLQVQSQTKTVNVKYLR